MPETPRYRDLAADLRRTYDASATARDASPKESWKTAEREAFRDRLRAGGVRTLLEVGAGPGTDSAWFRDQGFEVTATDLSPAMAGLCRAKGLTAHAADFLALPGLLAPASFDALYALNCLLHVPDADLPEVLTALRGLLRPGGLFFLGVYGGEAGEGIADWDKLDPPRFFAWRTDEALTAFATTAGFTVEDFHVVGVDAYRFQSLTLRRPDGTG